jgi:hypothetical protein
MTTLTNDQSPSFHFSCFRFHLELPRKGKSYQIFRIPVTPKCKIGISRYIGGRVSAVRRKTSLESPQEESVFLKELWQLAVGFFILEIKLESYTSQNL